MKPKYCWYICVCKCLCIKWIVFIEWGKFALARLENFYVFFHIYINLFLHNVFIVHDNLYNDYTELNADIQKYVIIINFYWI